MENYYISSRELNEFGQWGKDAFENKTEKRSRPIVNAATISEIFFVSKAL